MVLPSRASCAWASMSATEHPELDRTIGPAVAPNYCAGDSLAIIHPPQPRGIESRLVVRARVRLGLQAAIVVDDSESPRRRWTGFEIT